TSNEEETRNLSKKCGFRVARKKRGNRIVDSVSKLGTDLE
ncbi:hypothetical protein V3C99_002665, partial [Haemonchus contortus]